MKILFKTGVLAATTLALAASAVAQDAAPVDNLRDLLSRVRSDAASARQASEQRLRDFRANLAEQQSILSGEQATLNQLQREAAELAAQFEGNRERIRELDEELRDRQGSFGELFGAARQVAGELQASLRGSIVSAEVTGRGEALDPLATANRLPTREELDSIWISILEEIAAQSEVKTFNASVSGLSGSDGPVPVTRVGPFTAWTTAEGGAQFVEWNTAAQELRVLGRQPSGALRSAAATLTNSTATEVVRAPVDPSRGQLLSLLVESPDTRERIDQGGPVGYTVIALAIIGIIVGIWRLIALTLTGMAVSGQARKSTPSKGNPLGRVMMAYETSKNDDIEAIELKLDEAILKESPKLEFGLNLVKVLAGVAPLLGLLGTVTGMIITFQQITLFGTGDPRIMAGGISQALITTVLGLVAAIPLLLLHSFCATAARSVQQKLEEQAAGMVARHVEQNRGAA
ncbi:MAG: MotA/TolQ/ExbB proton channel family protein [Maricaulaceae bacterium]